MDTNWFVFTLVVFVLTSFMISVVGSFTGEDLTEVSHPGFEVDESLVIDEIIYNVTVPGSNQGSWSFNASSGVEEFHVEDNDTDILTLYVDLDNNLFGFESYNWTTEPTLFFFSNKIEVEKLIRLEESVDMFDNFFDEYDVDIRDGNEETILEGGFRGFIREVRLPDNHVSDEYVLDDYYYIEDTSGFIDSWFGDIPFLGSILTTIDSFMSNFVDGVEELPVWFNVLYFGTFGLIGSWLVMRLIRGN